MADVKISGLPASTVPLAGTEVLPIVQSSATKQVSVANLTAGRAVSATSYIPTGSAVPVNGIFLPAVNAVGIATNSGERARIHASGGVSIGNTTDPGASNLSLNQGLFQGSTSPTQRGTAYGAVNINNNSADGIIDFTQGLVFTDNINNTGAWTHAGICTTGSGGFNGNLIFGTDNSGTITNSITEKMRISAAGGVSIGDTTDPGAGNLRLGTGNLVIGTSGKGIDFSATAGTGTSELLADYEEGDWTPTVIGSSTAGTANYTTQIGRYTKIGRAVSIQMQLTWDSGTGSGAGMSIVGLPFTSASFNAQALAPGQVNNIVLSANNVLTVIISASSTTIGLQQYPVGGGAAASVAYDAAGQIMISGTYFV
jgi:hypothetical protein